jgi:hypothetical protein
MHAAVCCGAVFSNHFPNITTKNWCIYLDFRIFRLPFTFYIQKHGNSETEISGFVLSLFINEKIWKTRPKIYSISTENQHLVK